MSDLKSPRLNKLPFWLADLALLGAAVALLLLGGRPLRWWEGGGIVVSAALGAWMAILPFLKDHEAQLKAAELDRLGDATSKLDRLEALAERIGAATGQWQTAHEQATRTAELAKGVVDRLAREAETFATAVSRTADAEKQTLKLEIEKLHRGEADWLQTVGRIMDHVFALHLAAVKSKQASVADQIDRFHAACRDALRRVGFSLMVAAPDEPFDPRKHHTPEGALPPQGARVDETLAPGFLYQGRLLRPVLVKVIEDHPAQPAADPNATAPASSEPSLPAGDAAQPGTQPA